MPSFMERPIQFLRLDVVPSGAEDSAPISDRVLLLDPVPSGYKPLWKRKPAILVGLGMLLLLIFFGYIVISHACLRTHGSLGGCQNCNSKIVACPYSADSCQQCVVTQAKFTNGAGGCRVATFTCDPSPYPVVLGLTTSTGTVLDVAVTTQLTCGGNSIWMYQGQKIRSVTCKNPMTQQSPIDFVDGVAMKNAALNPAQLNYNAVTGDASGIHVVTTGDHAGWTMMFENPSPPASTLTESQLTGTYIPFNVHMHWVGDPVMTDGSEHTINGRHTRAEIHMVFYNSIYGSFANALGKKGGVHVIGTFVESGTNTAAYDIIHNALMKNDKADVPKADLATLNLADLLPADKAYYAYTGSLTTPEYTTCVDWTVMKQPITITAEQIAYLNTISTSPNVRPTQPVTGPVYESP